MSLKIADFLNNGYDHDIINLVTKKSSRKRKCTEISHVFAMKFMNTSFVNAVSHCKCLLQKSLPLLRQSLVAKELVIEGIRPPPHHTVVFSLPNSATVVPQLQVSRCWKFSEYAFQSWNQA
jgi:hypothetical protein